MFQKNRKRKISSEDLVFKDEEPQRKSARQQRNEEKKAAEKRAAEAAAAAKSNSGKRTVANLCLYHFPYKSSELRSQVEPISEISVLV